MNYFIPDAPFIQVYFREKIMLYFVIKRMWLTPKNRFDIVESEKVCYDTFLQEKIPFYYKGKETISIWKKRN